jgi:hypothetical protein
MFLSAINLTASYTEAVGSTVWTVWSGLDLRICAAVFMDYLSQGSGCPDDLPGDLPLFPASRR